MIIEEFQNRAEWLSPRPSFVGASETPALFSQGYKDQGRSTVYANKIAPIDSVVTDPMLLGIHLEPGIIAAANEKWNMDIVHSSYTLCRSDERKYIGFTPDGHIEDTHVEIKNLGSWSASKITDAKPVLPTMFNLQMQHQLYVSGRDRALFIANLANAELFKFWVERDEAIIALIVRQIDTFWNEYVLPQKMPHDEDPRVLQDALAQVFPEETVEVLQLNDTMQAVVDQRDILGAQIKEMESDYEHASAAMKKALGEAAFGKLPDGRVISWRKTKRKDSSRQLRVLKRLPKGVKPTS